MTSKKRKPSATAAPPLKGPDELDEYEVWRHYRLHSGHLRDTPGRQLSAEESSAYNVRLFTDLCAIVQKTSGSPPGQLARVTSSSASRLMPHDSQSMNRGFTQIDVEQARYGRAIKYKYATLYKEDVIAQLADEQRNKQAEWSRDEEERKIARYHALLCGLT